jgi:phospholipid/cholesterol/gamma-HCH transport system permease protein
MRRDERNYWIKRGVAVNIMAMTAPTNEARAEATPQGDTLVVRLGGDWRMTAVRPEWRAVLADRRPTAVRLVGAELGAWDSALALFWRDAELWCGANRAAFATEGLPPAAGQLAQLLENSAARTVKPGRGVPDLFTFVGLAAHRLARETKDIARLVGECLYSAGRCLKRPAKFRWQDCLVEMQHCGALALPIVGIVSFLVGVILAYQAAVQLRMYGADIFVADMVGLSIVREMGPLMAAVVLAGRTGAAFAATLGNMKAGEEIDALETLGISAIDFLVLPRLLALAAMTPLLALYSNAIGILGGMAVARGILDIPANAYWIETKSFVDLSDVSTGVLKSVAFGVLIGLSGCLRGLQAERSAAGVGRAATSAVVTSILLLAVADAVFAVAFNILGW